MTRPVFAVLVVLAASCGLLETKDAGVRMWDLRDDVGDEGKDVGEDTPQGPWCTPNCDGRECGLDGCGGICGECAPNQECSRDGACIERCLPLCEGRSCGDDGCGGACGTCPEPWVCWLSSCCMPRCEDRTCGDDGCGGTCGACSGGEICINHHCCAPQCASRECGPDGCMGVCGSCPPQHQCLEGQCQCVPQCLGKQCGSDGCGGSCGTCGPEETCTGGHCNCIPDCTGRVCGDNGCGGFCGFCVHWCDCIDGRCAGLEDPYVDGCDGTVTDPSTGLQWVKEAGPSRLWQVGHEHCGALTLGGYQDWRLPTIEELRSLILECPATQAEGACEAGDDCLSFACLSSPCQGCVRGEGPGPNGWYLHEIFESGMDSHYWSSVRFADNPASPQPLHERPVLFVAFDSARIGQEVTSVSLKAIRCVR